MPSTVSHGCLPCTPYYCMYGLSASVLHKRTSAFLPFIQTTPKMARRARVRCGPSPRCLVTWKAGPRNIARPRQPEAWFSSCDMRIQTTGISGLLRDWGKLGVCLGRHRPICCIRIAAPTESLQWPPPRDSDSTCHSGPRLRRKVFETSRHLCRSNCQHAAWRAWL